MTRVLILLSLVGSFNASYSMEQQKLEKQKCANIAQCIQGRIDTIIAHYQQKYQTAPTIEKSYLPQRCAKDVYATVIHGLSKLSDNKHEDDKYYNRSIKIYDDKMSGWAIADMKDKFKELEISNTTKDAIDIPIIKKNIDIAKKTMSNPDTKSKIEQRIEKVDQMLQNNNDINEQKKDPSLRNEFNDLKSDMKNEAENLKQHIGNNTSSIKSDMEKEIDGLKSDIQKILKALCQKTPSMLYDIPKEILEKYQIEQK